MLWKGVLSALVVAMLLVPQASAARTVTATYEIAFQNLTGQVADPVGVTSDGTVDYGGVTLAPRVGETSVTVTVTDAAGMSGQYIIVCQDSNVNNICGEAGEPRVAGCGTATVAIAPNGGGVRVFVSVQNMAAPSIGRLTVDAAPCGPNAALATTGTVTAVFS